jgi:nitrite reductase (NADH) small subunit
MQTAMIEEQIDICAVADLIEGAGIAALVGDTQIALFYMKQTEQVFALNNYDPFSEVNVISRGIIGSIGEHLVVASPVYKQHFSLTTGQCIEDENVSIDVYPVQINNGRILLGPIN